MMAQLKQEEQKVWRPTAPFREYQKTDEEVYQDGVQSGLDWPPHWAHLPGGPYYPRDYDKEEAHWKLYPSDNWHQDWFDYCRLLKRHHGVWMKGWLEGFRQNAQTNPEIRRLRTKLLLVKLVQA